MHTLDIFSVESEIQEKQVSKYGGPQASSGEDTNIALDQAKPRCIPPIILGFYFNHYLYVMLDYALSL
jgi:hypothetical protein